MKYTKEELHKVSCLVSDIMTKLYGMDGSGRLLDLFVRKLIAASKLKAYGIDDEYKLHVLSQSEIESIDNRICDTIRNVSAEAIENFANRIKNDFMSYKCDVTIGYIEDVVKEMVGESK